MIDTFYHDFANYMYDFLDNADPNVFIDPVPFETPHYKAICLEEDFQRLLQLGCPIHGTDMCGRYVLHGASARGHVGIVKMILERIDASYINLKQYGTLNSLTPLMFAVQNPYEFEFNEDRLDTVRVLLKYGANVDTRDDNQETALQMASGMMDLPLDKKDFKFVQLIIKELDEVRLKVIRHALRNTKVLSTVPIHLILGFASGQNHEKSECDEEEDRKEQQQEEREEQEEQKVRQ